MASSDSAASKAPPASAGGPKHDDAEENYKPKTLKFWLIISSMYFSIFLVALDRMIIATAIPSITDEFHSIEDIGWYGSGYMLTAAIFNPFFGRIYQLYSTKWVYLTAVVIFEAGSALCGAAPNSAAFIVGRAIAGMGSAGIFTGGIMITVPLVPLRRRPVFTSFFGLTFGVSSVLGPLVGGAFTDNPHLTWRWCFYINLPIGAFTIVAILLFLHLDSPPRDKVPLLAQFKRLDPLGLVFLSASMVCLILALQWGGSTYPWSEPKIIGLLVTFAVTFVIFLVVEAILPDTAMAPPRVVLNRSVGSALFYVLLLSGGMMTVAYYLNIWFQAAQGQSAIEAGVRTIPMMLSLVLFGFVAAFFTQKIGYYNPAMLLSPILCAIGGGLLSTLTPTSSEGAWIGYQVLYGLGIGSGFQTANLVPQTVLPRPDVPLGMGLIFFIQQLGGSIFISVGQNIFTNKLIDELMSIGDGLNVDAVVNAGATALRSIVPASQLGAIIDAYSNSLTRIFILTAALNAFTIFGALAVEWTSIKKAKKEAPKNIESGPEKEQKLEKSSEVSAKEVTQ